ncbi:heterokaryon incompatibility protein-domain-containing protein [Xylaria scruposa]|nr:heterokaryon incompatibility protein-domain-containing protein [Xylaria scruposa]
MMRLINVQTLTLEEFDRPPLPPYAILSHTWGEEEISFQDINDLQKASVKAGFTKFKLACRMTAAEQLQYVWIDTCCIDKSSGPELSEAINSMYQWYQSSSKCLVYLEDLPSSIMAGGPDGLLANCRWFKRGWTLQELVAPRTVMFYNQVWDFIGEKKSTALLSRISSATGIHQDILLNPDLIHTTSLAVRMSWAADRATSIREDVAYCLLGLFKINMPLLYGEGDRAFRRLQEEIIKTSNDLSIFAWYDEDNICGYHGMLADSPRVFRNFQTKILGSKPFSRAKKDVPYNIMDERLHITAKLLKYPSRSAVFMSLKEDETDGYQVGIMLQNISGMHIRIHAHRLFKVGLSFWASEFHSITAWIYLDPSTVFWIHHYPQILSVKPKASRATNHALCVDDNRPPEDAVSWGSLCSYCMGEAPPNTWKMRYLHSVQRRCVTDVLLCSKCDSTYEKTCFNGIRRSNIPQSCGITATEYVGLPQVDTDDAASLNGVETILDSLVMDKDHQDDQLGPFRPFRGVIFDIASKCFEIYKPYWLSEWSNESRLISQEASPFACPFMKMDSCKYRNCLRRTKIRTNFDLLEHLNLAHRQPLYCPVCSIQFQDIWTRDNHIRERSCLKKELIPPSGISVEERNQLRILLEGSSMKTLTYDGWYKVWDVLFPERAGPESPAIDRETEIAMSALQNFWMDYGSRLVGEFLASRGGSTWQIPNEERSLANLHSVILSDLMDRYLPDTPN